MEMCALEKPCIRQKKVKNCKKANLQIERDKWESRKNKMEA